jgi:hypothetical protein
MCQLPSHSETSKFEYLLSSLPDTSQQESITYHFWIYLTPPVTVVFLMANHILHNNNTVFLHFIILFLSISSLFVSSSTTILPFLQNYRKPIFRSNFHNIYDTSNYGVFQLTNGLALTPQMGFVSLFFSSFLSIHQNTFQFIISSCVDGTAGTSLHAISMKHLLRKQVLLFSSLVAPSPT